MNLALWFGYGLGGMLVMYMQAIREEPDDEFTRMSIQNMLSS